METALVRWRRTLAVAAVAWAISTVHAEIPQVISYQGKVTLDGGAAVPDGDYLMSFALWDSVAAGTALWSSNDVTVPVNGSVFSVMLGASPQPALTLTFDDDYWVEVTIEGDIQSPRGRLSSAGYAFIASGLVPGTKVIGSLEGSANPMFAAVNQSTAGYAVGVVGKIEGPSGIGVRGIATSGTGGANIGVHGESRNPDGNGVWGNAAATAGASWGTVGVSASPDGAGVWGSGTATTGTAFGVSGETFSVEGIGVRGIAIATTGANCGVSGETSSSEGCGTRGIAWAGSGETNGVYGQSDSPDGQGVYGSVTSPNGYAYGVWGVSESSSGRGVVGSALADSGSTRGVYGYSASVEGMGVVGYAGASTGSPSGVYGMSWSPEGFGVQGRAAATEGGAAGVHGWSGSSGGCGVSGYAEVTEGGAIGVSGNSLSPEGIGVYGLASATTGSPYGVYGKCESPNGYGVYGHTESTDGYGVYCAGNLAVSGAKSSVVATSRGGTLLYCQESPENWFEDFGEGRLVNGRCHIDLDPVFRETVTIDEQNPMKVFVELGGRCEGVYVEKGITGFDVVELRDGASAVRFDYRVVAKRRGFETKRLDLCAVACTDSYLYPELREKELRAHGAERTHMRARRALSEESLVRVGQERLPTRRSFENPVTSNGRLIRRNPLSEGLERSGL